MLIQFRTIATIMVSTLLVVAATEPFAQSNGQPGRDSKNPNPLKNVYFGEQHMHTQNSFDALTIGVRTTWEQAYRYGIIHTMPGPRLRKVRESRWLASTKLRGSQAWQTNNDHKNPPAN